MPQPVSFDATAPRPAWRFRTARVLSALVLTTFAAGQSAAPSASTAETVVLTPFEVTTTKDVGFVANSSLAGGRLAGDLKDTPAAYSVLTREFIDALGLTDLVEASQWTVNSTNNPTDGSGEIFGSYNEVTTRGVSSSAPQRNFFPQNVNFDSYNLERFDYSRGPNSILFGAGSFGGAANVVTKSARPERATNSLRIAYGSWANQRVNFDLNRPLNKTFALRLNGLWSDRDGWRDWEKERKKAATLAATWKISRQTDLRLEAESGAVVRNNPATYLRDQFAGWDGRTTFSGPVTALPANAAALGLSLLAAPYFIYAPGLGTTNITNFGNTARTTGGNSTAATPVGGVLVVGPTANISANPINEALSLPANLANLAVAGSNFRLPRRSFAMSTNTPTTKQTFSNYTATLRQQIGPRVFVEVAGNYAREHSENQYFNVRGLGDIIIDINRTLPSGGDNPHFLDAYSDGTRSRRLSDNEWKNGRFAVAYIPDKTRFGEYIFNTYGGITKSKRDQRIESLRVLRNADPRRWPFNDGVAYRYYFNETDRPMPDIDTATFNGVTYPVGWVGDSARSTDISQTYSTLRYLQGAVRAKFFTSRLHFLGAVRYDDVDNGRWLNDNYGDYPANWDGRLVQYLPTAAADYAGLTYTPKDASGQPVGAPVRADVRPRDASRIPLPQYAGDRFQDDYSPPNVKVGQTTYSVGSVLHVNRVISLFGNYATSFNPPGSSLKYDGSFNPAQESKGFDAGVRLSFLNQRLMLSLGYYGSQESNQQVQSTITGNINSFANANAIGDLSSGGRNTRGLVDVPTQVFDTRDRKNRGYELEVVANLSSSWRLSFNAALPEAYQLNAFSDSRAYLSTNDAKLRQIARDTGVTIGADNAAVVDLAVPVNTRSPDASAVAAAWNSLINFQQTLVTGRQKIVGVTKVTSNLFTDYRFKEGRLRGISVGGGVNYRGPQIIGYRGSDTIVNPANPLTAIDDPSVDAYSTVSTKAYFVTTAVFGYNRKLGTKRTLELQLRVANLLNEDMPLYYDTVQRPIGGDIRNPARIATPRSFAYQTPRAYTFSATISF